MIYRPSPNGIVAMITKVNILITLVHYSRMHRGCMGCYIIFQIIGYRGVAYSMGQLGIESLRFGLGLGSTCILCFPNVISLWLASMDIL